MAYWLFKEEPDHYNLADLERERTTYWDGVTNNQARLHLRKVQAGDHIWFYHTGKEKAIVGEMRALGGPEVDPNYDDAKAVMVKVEFVRRLQYPVPLSRIKEDSRLTDWDLVRNSRLSVVPVTEDQWQHVLALAAAADRPAAKTKGRNRS